MQFDTQGSPNGPKCTPKDPKKEHPVAQSVSKLSPVGQKETRARSPNSTLQFVYEFIDVKGLSIGPRGAERGVL